MSKNYAALCINESRTKDQKIFFEHVQETNNDRRTFPQPTHKWFVTVKMYFLSQKRHLKRQQYDIDHLCFENRTDFFHGNRLKQK